jgi:hypothetical protein
MLVLAAFSVGRGTVVLQHVGGHEVFYFTKVGVEAQYTVAVRCSKLDKWQNPPLRG